METQQMTLIRTMVDAMKELDQAKKDAKAVIDSAFDAYEQNGGTATKKEMRVIAKAVMEAETKEVAASHQRIADVLDSIGK